MAVADGSLHEIKQEDSADADTGLAPSATAAEEDHHVYPELSVTSQVMITLTVTLSMMLNVCTLPKANLRRCSRVGRESLTRGSLQIMQTQATTLALEHIGRDLNILTTNLQW